MKNKERIKKTGAPENKKARKMGAAIMLLVVIVLVLLSFRFTYGVVGDNCDDSGDCDGSEECHYNTCHLPVGSSCSDASDCCGEDCTWMGCDSSGQCCGKSAYPCNFPDSSNCCDDPLGCGDFRCASNNMCTCNCTDADCEDWVNDTCGGGNCAYWQMHQTRTCPSNTCCSGNYVSRCVDSGCGAAPKYVDACQELNESNTLYVLNTSITSNSGVCFNITADNITLEGQGYWVTYAISSTGIAIYSKGSNHITIKNIRINQTSTTRINSPAIKIMNSYNNNLIYVVLSIAGEDYPDAYN